MAQKSLGQLLAEAKALQDAAWLTKDFGQLNTTILQILREHLNKVIVQFAPKRPHVWDDHLAVLQVVYGGYILSIPIPELRHLDRELSQKVRIKMSIKVEIKYDMFAQRDVIFVTSEENLSVDSILVAAVDAFGVEKVTEIGVKIKGGWIVSPNTKEQFLAGGREMSSSFLGAALAVGGNVNDVVEMYWFAHKANRAHLCQLSVLDNIYPGLSLQIAVRHAELIAAQDTEEWRQVLSDNAQIEWVDYPDGRMPTVSEVDRKELDLYPKVRVAHRVEFGVTKSSTTYWLLPPSVKGKTRVLRRSWTSRKGWFSPDYMEFEADSFEAKEIFSLFGEKLCPRPGYRAVFGFFAIYNGNGTVLFSNRMSGGGQYLYSRDAGRMIN